VGVGGLAQPDAPHPPRARERMRTLEGAAPQKAMKTLWPWRQKQKMER
jgi:hypothetical protein